MVESGIEALGRCGLTKVLMVDHDPHELTTTVVNDHCRIIDVVMEGYYHLIMVVLLTTTVVNVQQPLLSVESSNLYKIIQFPTFSLN